MAVNCFILFLIYLDEIIMLLILKLCAYVGYNMHEFHFSIINRALPSKYYKLAFGSDGLGITADLWLSNSNVSESPAGPHPKNVHF